MSAQARPTQEQAQLVQQSQLEQQRILRAVTLGLKFLEDEAVSGPMKYADGVTDLKWLLRQLASGGFNINLDPTGQRAGAMQPPGKLADTPLSEFATGKDGAEGKEGNGADKK